MTAPNRSIAGRVAIVTGAASGMGRATARLFASEGAKVGFCDVDAAGVGLLSDELGPFDARGHVVDLAEPAAVTGFVDAVRTELGPIDIVVNNAGVSVGAPLDDDAFEDHWAFTFAVNLDAQMRVIRACVDDLKRNGDGRIVNISSTEGLGGSAGISPYTASKHGVVGLTKALAVELGRSGVTVNAVCPGPINTGMTSEIPDDHKVIFAKRKTALGRYGEPEEVAQVTLSLVLPASSYITGVAIPVDGGMRARNN